MRRKTNIQSLNSTYQTNVRKYRYNFDVRKQCADQVGCYRRGQLPKIVIKSQSTHLNHNYSIKTEIVTVILYAVQGLGLLTSTPLGAVLAKFSILHENSYLSQTQNSSMGAVPNFTTNPANRTRQMEEGFLSKMNLTCHAKLNSHSCSNR